MKETDLIPLQERLSSINFFYVKGHSLIKVTGYLAQYNIMR